MATFKLEVITPDKHFYNDEIEMVIVRGVEGDLAVMRGHIPFVTPLAIGKLRIKKDGQYREAAISGGFISVQPDKTTIMTDSAEWPEEIDANRAEEAKKRAEERLQQRQDKIDRARAQAAFERAMNRLNVANK
jgi:F-type H+-transporting ATPase subunit epsilon